MDDRIVLSILEGYRLTLRDESGYRCRSTDNPRCYATEYFAGDEVGQCGASYTPACAHGISVSTENGEQLISSAVLIGSAGASGVHEDSMVVIGDTCFVAVSHYLLALSVPDLQMRWAKAVDMATCFGVYRLPGDAGLITWGELFICRYTLAGEEVWVNSGNDIFTEGFSLENDRITVVDFNEREWCWGIDGELVER